MKLLAFVDLHGEKKLYTKLLKKAKKEKPNFSICAGDFTTFEHNIKDNMRKLSKLGKLFLLHGNHEEAIVVGNLSKLYKDIEFIHRKIVVHKGIMLIGWGGGGFTIRDIEFEAWIRENKKQIKQHKGIKILVTHAPFYGTAVDNLNDEHHGCKSFSNFIKKYKINFGFCGHFHENGGVKGKLRQCSVFNPGPEGVVINF